MRRDRMGKASVFKGYRRDGGGMRAGFLNKAVRGGRRREPGLFFMGSGADRRRGAAAGQNRKTPGGPDISRLSGGFHK